jgi:hypothetical protein
MAKKESPFGKDSRLRSLRQHFDETGPYDAASAWKFVYRELMWFDGSNGLAHLYESDKAQPGRSQWYDRTVRFTDELMNRMGAASRAELKAQLDRLFRDCLEKLLQVKAAEKGADIELEELEEEESAGVAPEAYIPDADLVAEFAAILGEQTELEADAALTLAKRMVSRARHYFTVERKRQNILGEGFEDLLFLLATKVSEAPKEVICLRQKANTLPGFGAKHKRERIESPDLAFVGENTTDLLISVKWSIRQDRQKQWADELDCYIDLMSQMTAPKFLLITNEYDPGRILNAFSLDRQTMKLGCIYHISLDMLEVALNDHPTWSDVKTMIDAGRLKSLAQWLEELQLNYGSR